MVEHMVNHVCISTAYTRASVTKLSAHLLMEALLTSYSIIAGICNCSYDHINLKGSQYNPTPTNCGLYLV